jgi:hypothetical protein
MILMISGTKLLKLITIYSLRVYKQLEMHGVRTILY